MVQKSHLRSSFSRKMYVHIQVHIQPTNINVSLNQKDLCNAKKKWIYQPVGMGCGRGVFKFPRKVTLAKDKESELIPL